MELAIEIHIIYLVKKIYEDFPNKEHNAKEQMRCLEHGIEVN
jgi:hypothetical protein